MYHIYLGLSLSLICLFLVYLISSKFLLVTVLCVILAGLYFKDDFILFRYLAVHVASFYAWICDLFLGIQNMYHQSNNTNFPVRKAIENNGAVSRKFERLHHGPSYNLSTSYIVDNQPITSGIWESGSKFPSPVNNFSNRTHSTVQELSKLNISHFAGGEMASDRYVKSKSYNNSSNVSPMRSIYTGYSRNTDPSRTGILPSPASIDCSSNNENKPLNAKLYADVSSPGFCGRVADRLHDETMTHQSKYDTVGAFPVVNLKSHSPKIKIKTPVRVRLAPPSSELVQYNYGANIMPSSPILGPDDSMKSVLQVLKEISRKRIHSHVDDGNEEGSKRLRVTDSQFESDGLLHTSLLQQTIQGKRAREETSPNEDDKKRRKASLKNNEIMSSLSSSISVRPPHLQTAKRKAQSIDDSNTSTPVLGKLLKVQAEISPPAPTNHIAAPEPDVTVVEELSAKTSKSPAIPSPIVPPPAVVEPAPPKVTTEAAVAKKVVPEEDGAVSRLLGRMSDHSSHSPPAHIPVKKNVFMSTNDLSLSPPKENRLAAMIAVLGGPSEPSELENIQSDAPKQPERLIKGKALFSSPEMPETPETPKQNKKVTFSDSLTTTKIFERDEPDSKSSAAPNSNSVLPPSTPLTSVAFSSAPNTTPTGAKLTFGTENTTTLKPFSLNFGSSPLSSDKEVSKPNDIGTSSAVESILSPAIQNSGFQMPSTNLNFTPVTSPASVSGPTFSVPAPVSNSNNLIIAPATGGFSFGANSSVNPSKESSPKHNTNSSSVNKPFSFGNDSKTSQPAASAPGFPLLFPPVTSKNETANTSLGQNKPMLNIFGNKDTSGSTSKNDGENKPLVNGFAPTSNSSSPFALSQPVSQASASKPLLSFGANANTTTTSQSAPTFNFGSTTAFSQSPAASLTTQPSASSTFTSTPQQTNTVNPTLQSNSLISTAASPSLNMFSSSVSSPSQSKPSPFGSVVQGKSAFGDSVFKPVSSNQTSQPNSVFGNTPAQSSGFGSTPALQNGSVSSTSGTTQNSNIFGNISSNSTNKPITFGSEQNATTQSSNVFGFSGTPASTQASSPFGITMNNTMSNTPTIFGNTATEQPASVFGSRTPTTGLQNSNTFSTPATTAGQQPLFGTIANNDVSKNMFASASNTTPTFGGLGSGSNSTFGTHNTPTTFGGQNTTTAPTFGNQSTPTFSFGSKNTGSNPTQVGFGGAVTFGGSSSSSSANEIKPPAFGAASPFMFASKPTEAVKPLGTATPFAFGSSTQSSSSLNPAQSSVPSFGTSTPTFGASQPAPAFGAGTLQPAAPAFQFGQASSSTASAFQFNAAPPTAGGGMFSIGSGGSSTSRTKTTALRRSQKRT